MPIATLPRLLRHLLLPAALLTAQAQAAEPQTVRIATVAYANAGKTIFNGPSYVMDRDKWLEQQLAQRNIKLQWVPAATASVGTFVNEEFANRRIDFAFYGDLPSIIANASGVSTQLIVPGGSGNNVYLVVPPGSSAKSIADLKGKRIALHRGRPWELSFAKLLDANQLRFDDFRIFNLNPQAGAAALSAGRVDALFTLSDAYLLEDKQVGRIIWSSKQAPADWRMRAELWGAKDFIAQQPEITQLVVDAYLKAAHWTAQPENQAAYQAYQAQSGQPLSVLQREAEGQPWAQHFSPLYDQALRQHYTDAIAYALKARLIRGAVNVETLLEPKFVQQGLQNLQLQQYWTVPVASVATQP
ncbi:ABC transporter substrate-binding protein [Pseudomonas guariconensis]|uniref:Nitrate ABC transporter substrate-binding protein n=1 Tax=Pseudomonas putida TaxID=303 RepID=A0A6S5T9A1_PSEPU|nr:MULTISPECIES: ABC transporter substrate-binding protein [Pseudomonas]BBT39631.1 nitrate ABC transporter substrate-binding protein [Pseudomonas putida]SDD53864.1 sulfonate transport system substrate-binding protein [Pseudomonas guariconensis]